MRIKLFLASIIILAAFLSPHALAGLYKWVDENGDVQYSDKPPSNKGVTNVKTLKTTRASPFELPEQKQAALKPVNREVRNLWLLDTTYFWDENKDYKYSRKIGSYFVGKKCSPRGEIKVPEVFSDHKSFVPKKTKKLTYAIRRAIDRLDYSAHRIEEYELLAKLKRNGGLSLHSQITELKIHSCAPKLSSSQRSGAVGRISDSKFTQHRIRLKVRWQLKDNRDQLLVYETTSDGAYDGWNNSKPIKEVMDRALESAVHNLFADEMWLDKVLIEVAKVDTRPYNVEQPKPIKLTRAQQGNLIYLTLDPWQWQKEIIGQEEFGQFYFGKECQTGTPVNLDEMVLFQQYMITSRSPAEIAVRKASHPLGYSFRSSSKAALEKYNTEGGLYLTGDLVGLSMQACAPDLKAELKFTPLKTLSWSHFYRQKVKIRIRWSLYQDGGKKPVYVEETDGYGGDLLKRWKNRDPFNNAIKYSIRTLLSKQAFIRLVIK